MRTRGAPPQLDSRERKTYRDDHGTPTWMLDLVRRIHGRIDIDLASTAEDNIRVGARKFYTPKRPCPAKIVEPGQVIYCNPPGPGKKVQQFWEAWNCGIASGAEGAFLFFSADYMRKASSPAVKSYVLIPSARLKFYGNDAGCSWVSALVSTKPPRLGTDWLLGNWLTGTP